MMTDDGMRNMTPEGEQQDVQLKLKIGIVGHGFVGGAVDYALPIQRSRSFM